MKIKKPTKKEVEVFQEIEAKANNLPQLGVPGFLARLGAYPDGFTLYIYPIEETKDGQYEYQIDSDLELNDKISESEKAQWKSEKDKLEKPEEPVEPKEEIS